MSTKLYRVLKGDTYQVGDLQVLGNELKVIPEGWAGQLYTGIRPLLREEKSKEEDQLRREAGKISLSFSCLSTYAYEIHKRTQNEHETRRLLRLRDSSGGSFDPIAEFTSEMLCKMWEQKVKPEIFYHAGQKFKHREGNISFIKRVPKKKSCFLSRGDSNWNVSYSGDIHAVANPMRITEAEFSNMCGGHPERFIAL